jgi:lactate 2-monooxygenase
MAPPPNKVADRAERNPPPRRHPPRARPRCRCHHRLQPGGRQADGAIAALDALPAVAAAIQQKIPILFDSGIRYGSDAIKALALGARAVLLARLYLWSLAIAGEQGVRDVLQNFLADLDLTMGLSGFRSVRELDASILEK